MHALALVPALLTPHPGADGAQFLEPVHVLREIVGEAAGDQFGWIGRNAGDCDGDGKPELLISAPYKDVGGANAGRIYVYSGATGELLFQKSGQPGDFLGIGIEGAGDVDGDGHADVLAGAHQALGGVGGAFVFSGKDGEPLLEVFGEAVGDAFGRKLAGAGDMDGDGHADLFVGAGGFDGPAGIDAGRAYLVSGADGSFLAVLDGDEAGDRFGSAVDAVVDGETRLLIAGAQHAGEGNRGAVYVFEYEPDADPEPAFVIESQEGDVNLGRMFVSAVGDVNGDGVVDVYGSDWESNAGGLAGSGRIYVHSGRDGERLYTLGGEVAGEGFGIGTAEAGDVDGDGHDDLIIGAWQSARGATSGGRCLLYSGKDGRLVRTYTSTVQGETFGFDTTGLGDLDGDGQLDFLITAAYNPARGVQTGRILVVSAAHRKTDAKGAGEGAGEGAQRR